METNQPLFQGNHHKSSRFLFWGLIVLTLISLLFRITWTGGQVGIGEIFIIALGACLLTLIWIAGRLSDSTFLLARSGLLYALGFVWFSQALSTIFSLNRHISFSGSLSLGDDLLFITALIVLAYLATLAFQALPRVVIWYLVLLGSAAIIFVSDIIHVISSSSLLGDFYDTGILFGLVSLVSLVFIEFFPDKAFFRRLSLITLIFSLISLIFINFQIVWWMVGLGAILIFLLRYRLLSTRAYFSMAVIGISLVCIIMGRSDWPLATLANRVVPAPLEARPSWSGTYELAKESIKEYPIFGVGPGLFSRQWVKYKPLDVNATPHWFSDFDFGVGYLVSGVVTSGLLGLLAWAIFLLLILKRIIHLFRNTGPAPLWQVYHLATYISVLYLWIFAVIYVPGMSLLAIAAICTGLLVALEISTGSVNSLQFSPLIYPRLKSLATLIVIILGLGTLSLAYGYVNDYRATLASATSRDFVEKGDTLNALASIEEAISLDDQDTYRRHSADVYIISLVRSVMLSGGNEEIASQEFVRLYGAAVREAMVAAAFDSTNYLNFIKLGSVYESVVELGVEGAYEQAREAYGIARDLNPTSPVPPYLLARLEVVNGNISASIEYLNESVTKKPNYAPAYMLASQIALTRNDLTTAIQVTELGVLSDPSDFSAFFQLGYLRYQNGDYELAKEALVQAVYLNPQYANTHYFLGLSYARLGENDLAIAELETVLLSNPGNTELENILDALKSGKRVF